MDTVVLPCITSLLFIFLLLFTVLGLKNFDILDQSLDPVIIDAQRLTRAKIA